MANEFIIKNGYVSKGDSIVEGGLTATTISANTISTTTLTVNGVSITGDTFVTGGTYATGTITFRNNQNNTFPVTGLTTGVTITNNTNNYLLTATGSDNIFNGESNLTFDGNTLSVLGIGTGGISTPSFSSLHSGTTTTKISNQSQVVGSGTSNTTYASRLLNTVSGGTNIGFSSTNQSFVGNQYGFYSSINGSDSTNRYGFYSDIDAGSISTTNYGVFINFGSSLPVGSTNYSIYTNKGIAIFNDDGDANSDFRIEGDTNTHLFFVDSSTNTIGINNSSPSEKLHVTGNVLVDGNISVTGTTDIEGSINYKPRTANLTALSPNTNVTSTDNVIYASSSGLGTKTITLPAISATTNGRVITVVYVSATATNLQLQTTGSDTINGAATKVANTQYDSITVISNTTTNVWYIMSEYPSGAWV